MDAFWFIPTLILAAVGVRALYMRIGRDSMETSAPRVLFHSTSEEPAVSRAVTEQNWSDRPCGSVLEWRARHEAQRQ